ncbi:MAG: RnfABCDGE type electron transport complex subunit B [Burkholderiaceae bacterium]
MLPQTQCTRCGYPSCREYAHALAQGETRLNRCPPGGEAGIRQLAALLETPALPLDPETGTEGPRLLAFIEPEPCIGCTKCIRACPVDAIIGGPRRMHTVLPELCTGCELCVPPCPVDCIPMLPVPQLPWQPDDAQAARQRFVARQARLEREARDDQDRHARELAAKWRGIADHESDDQPTAGQPSAQAASAGEPDAALTRKRAIVAAALARAARRQQSRPPALPLPGKPER